MSPLRCIALGLLSLLPFLAQAQSDLFDYGFTRYQHIPVYHTADALDLPWAGGMNAVYISPIDLNLDGIQDLVAFEKHGDRILPFLFQNGRYHYVPHYAPCFPRLHDWAIHKDYDGDGKSDIFTYGLAGIRVFHNSSTDTLSFTLVTEQLPAWYYNGYVNLYASPDDYPAIDDIDGDGQTDVLNFWVLGKYVHWLRNYSGHSDSFDLRLEESCWGHFSEADDNNTITLFTDCDDKQGDDPLRHTGSSLLWIDIDDDGTHDLLVGDVDSPHLIYLHNGGTDTDALMDAQDTLFPAHAPIELYSMPAPALVSLPGESRPSLLISPSDPSLAKSQDLNSVWRYDYDTLLHQYILIQQDFLQGSMIDVGSGCRPVLYDWDGDGLEDLFLANYGQFDSAEATNGFLTSHFSSSIRYYRNTGTASQPAFQLEDEDFGALRPLNRQALHPTFGDLDGDGLTDMLCGDKEGHLMLVTHHRLTTGIGPVTEHYLNISTDGFSTPQLFDLDGDGHQDLLLGNRRGTIHYYHRNASGAFEFVTDTLGMVDVRDFSQSYFGHSVPCFYRDPQRGTLLFCGSESGNIFYYKNIDDNLSGSFTLAEQTLAETVNGTPLRLCEGTRCGAAVGLLNDDALPDMLIGNYAGGVSLFLGSEPMPHGTGVGTLPEADIYVYPNPTTGLLHCNSTSQPVTSLELFDLFGRSVLRSNQDFLDLSSLPTGFYVLLVNHQTRLKIIKQ